MAQMVKNLPAVRETWVRSLSWKDPVEEGMAAHSNIFAWKIPRTEEPGRLQLMRSPGKHQAPNEHILNKVTKWLNDIPFS